MTRERAEELLAEKGMYLQEMVPPPPRARIEGFSVTVRVQSSGFAVRRLGYDEVVATGSNWREAASEALGIPAF